MIINLDCRRGMSLMPDNSVDAVVTDPPYGLSKHPDIREVLSHWLAGDDYSPDCGGFMGKKWDSFVPGPLVWEQALRVLKPGGYLVAFAGSRTVDLMAMSLRIGGFQIVDMLHWLYGSGMPKSMAIDKAIDKQRHDRAEILAVTAWVKNARDAAGLSNADIDRAFGFNGVAGHWTSQKSQPSVPTLDQIPPLLALLGSPDVPERVRHLIYELNGREGQPGRNWAQREVVGQHEENCRTSAWSAKWEGREHDSEGKPITKAHSEKAKQWDGWGTALKPCHEPIILARKPLDGTYANNVLAHGVGALNIDGCRVGDTPMDVTRSTGELRAEQGTTYRPDKTQQEVVGTATGRWPGNVLHDGCLPAPMDRYFYSAKATRADRERGGVKNTHPTVKPTELMRWLCRLVTPPGGLILDPFAGSGSTGCGAVLEGYRFTGFELSAEYAAIATARINSCL